MQQPGNRAALTFFHLAGQQGFEIADMGLPFPGRGIRQAGKLTADRRHAQRLAVLTDGVFLKLAHQAAPTHAPDSSVS
jgi:hypothetical protein